MEPFELRPLTLGEIIRRTFRLYGETVAVTVTLGLIAHAPLLLLGALIQEGAPPDPVPTLGLLVLILVVRGIVVTALYMALLSAVLKRPLGVGPALRGAMTRTAAAAMLGYMLTTFFSHISLLLLVLPGLALVGMMMIVPSLFLGGLLAAAVPAIVVERKGAIGGMGRSIALLRPLWARGMGVFAFGTAVSELLPLQLMLAIQLGAGRSPFSPLLAVLLAAITMPLTLAANLLLYLSARAEGGAVEALRAELQRRLPGEP